MIKNPLMIRINGIIPKLNNNAKISFYTSQSSICYCSNILTDNIKVSKN